MDGIFQHYSWARIRNPHTPLSKAIGWGLFGGLAATLAMDLILMGLLAAAGLPPFTCYSIVGDTVASFFSLKGIGVARSVPLGIAAHYAIGPLMGGLFGAAVAKVKSLRVDTMKKGLLVAVLFAEILSQPMLAMTPILLKMTASAMLQWYIGSFAMHLIWGCILGFVWSRGLRMQHTENRRREVPAAFGTCHDRARRRLVA